MHSSLQQVYRQLLTISPSHVARVDLIIVF